ASATTQIYTLSLHDALPISDPVDHVDYGARIGIEQRFIVGRNRRGFDKSGWGRFEHVDEMGLVARGPALPAGPTIARARLVDLGSRPQIWGSGQRGGRGRGFVHNAENVNPVILIPIYTIYK